MSVRTISSSKKRSTQGRAGGPRGWVASCVLIASYLLIACATTVSSEEIKRLCADGHCGRMVHSPDAGVATGGVENGGTTGGGGSSEGGTVANGGTLPMGGTAQGGTTNIGGGGSGGMAGGAGGNGGATGGVGGAITQGGTAGTGGMAGSSGSGGTGGSGGAGGAGGTGGAGGSGGSGGAVACPAKTTWTATASMYCGSAGACQDPNGPFPPTLAIDASIATRYSSGQPQAGNEWIQIDFGKSVSLTSVTIDTEATNADDWGRQYEFRVSNTSGDMAAAIAAQGAGMTGAKMFTLTATGRYLLISQKGVYATSWWSVHDINVACH